MFYGFHERQLDDKGRVALPALYREEFRGHCVLTQGEGRCIDVLPVDDFDAEVERVRSRVRAGDLPIWRQRSIMHSAIPGQIDKQGRVKVDERLRRYASLDLSSKVIVAGNDDRLEVWSVAVYEEEAARADAEMARSGL